MKQKRFSFHLFRLYTAVIISTAVIVTLLSTITQTRELHKDLLKKGDALVGLLSAISQTGVYTNNRAVLLKTTEGFLQVPEMLAVVLYLKNGEILIYNEKTPWEFNYSLLEKGSLGNLKKRGDHWIKEDDLAIEIVHPVIIEKSLNSDLAMFLSTEDLPKEEDLIGYAKVVVSKAGVKKEVRSTLRRNCFIAAVFVVTGTGVIFLLTRRATKHLTDLTVQVKSLEESSDQKVLVGSDDEIGRLASAFNDLLGRLRIREKELSRARRMEALGTLARGIAHDFNNILGAIHNAAYILEDAERGSEVHRKYIEHVRVSIDRAQRLIKALFSFSREQGSDMSPVSLREALEEMMPLVATLQQDGIRVFIDMPKCPATILGNKAQIEQIIINLVNNACDAMPSGGDLSVTLNVVQNGVQHSGGGEEKAVLCIKDTGEGMTKEMLDKIFEPFFTTRDVDKGRGLGLSIVYGIVKLHRGHIAVQSEPGHGTEFKISFPLYVEGNTEEEIGKKNTCC